jgi:hypothetical protein
VERSNKTYDKKDLPRAATFIADDIGLEIILKPAQVVQDPHTGTWGRAPNSGLTRRFKGGRHVCYNKSELKLIMDSSAFKNGQIRRDPEDPTRFWRELGIASEKMVPVAVAGEGKLKVTFDELKLEDLTKPEPEEKVLPLSQVV